MRVIEHYFSISSKNKQIRLTSSFFNCIGFLLLSALIMIGDLNNFVSSAGIPVCCPLGSYMVNFNQGFFRSKKYECLSKSISANQKDSIVFFEAGLIQGFQIHQIDTAMNSSIPQCENPILIRITGEADLTSRSCLIKLHDVIYAISCPLTENDVPNKFSVIRKCCPIDYIYHVARKRCVVRDFPLDYYQVFFDHPVALNDHQLKCSHNNAVVEYRLGSNEFTFEEGNLVIKETNELFDHSEYCVEGVVNDEDQHNIRINGSNKNLNASLRFLIRTCNQAAICEQLPCIRRCCADGEFYVRGSRLSYCIADTSDINFHSFESLEFSANFTKPAVFGMLRGLDCKKYKLDPDLNFPEDVHAIRNWDGSLYLHSLQKTYSNAEYCLEMIHNSSWGRQKLFTFLCFEDVGKDNIKFNLYSVGLLISCAFYAITLLVYLSISKLRNLPGKILICLVSSLFTAYLGIAVGQITPPNDKICYAYAFFIYFSLIAAFAWMNVMCFDIWQTFGSSQKSRGLNGHTKKFIFYSFYGWGLPTFLTITTICLTKYSVISENLRPKFGHGRCWFQHTLAASQLIFFSGPVGVLFLFNFVLFALTLRYCNKVKREIFRMQSTNVEKPVLRKRFYLNKARFMMNTKLFIVMGITWFLEILSTIFYDRKRTFFWIISDSFNVLLGVLVFCIFVFKRRVWHSILNRLGIKTKESTKSLRIPTSATQTSRTNSVSMARINGLESNLSLLTPFQLGESHSRCSNLTLEKLY